MSNIGIAGEREQGNDVRNNNSTPNSRNFILNLSSHCGECYS